MDAVNESPPQQKQRRQFKLFWLIFFGQSSLIIFALILYSFVTSVMIDREFKKHILHDLSNNVLFFTLYMSPEYFDPGYPIPENSTEILIRISGGTNTRLTLISTSGDVTFDTDADADSMNNHRTRPEVIEALAGRTGSSIRFSSTLQENRIYFAVPYIDGVTVRGVIRVSYSYSSVEEAVTHTLLTLQICALIIIIFSVFLIIIMDKKITSFINRIKGATLEIAKGNYNVSMPWSVSSEIGEMSTAITEMSAEIRRQMEKVNEKNLLLKEMTLIDELTQLGNRRKFETLLKHQWSLCLRDSSPISMIIGDIDYFKRYNDSLGHPEGDICLQKISTILSGIIRRSSDILARIGGEEFGIILPGTDADEGRVIGEKILNALRQTAIPHPDSPIASFVTMSLGIHTIVPESGDERNTLFSLADKHLYMAKKGGRNRISDGLYAEDMPG